MSARRALAQPKKETFLSVRRSGVTVVERAGTCVLADPVHMAKPAISSGKSTHPAVTQSRPYAEAPCPI